MPHVVSGTWSTLPTWFAAPIPSSLVLQIVKHPRKTTRATVGRGTVELFEASWSLSCFLSSPHCFGGGSFLHAIPRTRSAASFTDFEFNYGKESTSSKPFASTTSGYQPERRSV
jgi:hypothetical protein